MTCSNLLSSDTEVDVFLKAPLFFIAATISNPPPLSPPAGDDVEVFRFALVLLPSFCLFCSINSLRDNCFVGGAIGGGGGTPPGAINKG